jgi:hypothetical protein
MENGKIESLPQNKIGLRYFQQRRIDIYPVKCENYFYVYSRFTPKKRDTFVLFEYCFFSLQKTKKYFDVAI